MEELKNLVKFGPPPLAHLSAIKKDEELENEKKKGRISPKKLIAISPVKPGRSPAPPQPFQFDNSEVFFSRLRDPEETKVSQPPPPFLSPSQNDFALHKLLNSGYTISAKSIFEIPSHNDKLHLLSDLQGLARIRRSYESERLRVLSLKVRSETEARCKLESSIKLEKTLTSKLSNATRELNDKMTRALRGSVLLEIRRHGRHSSVVKSERMRVEETLRMLDKEREESRRITRRCKVLERKVKELKVSERNERCSPFLVVKKRNARLCVCGFLM